MPITRHAIEWDDSNKVKLETRKTEVVVFSKQRKVLQAAREARIRIGEHEFSINRGVTSWLGFDLIQNCLLRRTLRKDFRVPRVLCESKVSVEATMGCR